MMSTCSLEKLKIKQKNIEQFEKRYENPFVGGDKKIGSSEVDCVQDLVDQEMEVVFNNKARDVNAESSNSMLNVSDVGFLSPGVDSRSSDETTFQNTRQAYAENFETDTELRDEKMASYTQNEFSASHSVNTSSKCLSENGSFSVVKNGSSDEDDENDVEDHYRSISIKNGESNSHVGSDLESNAHFTKIKYEKTGIETLYSKNKVESNRMDSWDMNMVQGSSYSNVYNREKESGIDQGDFREGYRNKDITRDMQRESKKSRGKERYKETSQAETREYEREKHRERDAEKDILYNRGNYKSSHKDRYEPEDRNRAGEEDRIFEDDRDRYKDRAKIRDRKRSRDCEVEYDRGRHSLYGRRGDRDFIRDRERILEGDQGYYRSKVGEKDSEKGRVREKERESIREEKIDKSSDTNARVRDKDIDIGELRNGDRDGGRRSRIRDKEEYEKSYSGRRVPATSKMEYDLSDEDNENTSENFVRCESDSENASNIKEKEIGKNIERKETKVERSHDELGKEMAYEKVKEQRQNHGSKTSGGKSLKDGNSSRRIEEANEDHETIKGIPKDPREQVRHRSREYSSRHHHSRISKHTSTRSKRAREYSQRRSISHSRQRRHSRNESRYAKRYSASSSFSASSSPHRYISRKKVASPPPRSSTRYSARRSPVPVSPPLKSAQPRRRSPSPALSHRRSRSRDHSKTDYSAGTPHGDTSWKRIWRYDSPPRPVAEGSTLSSISNAVGMLSSCLINSSVLPSIISSTFSSTTGTSATILNSTPNLKDTFSSTLLSDGVSISDKSSAVTSVNTTGGTGNAAAAAAAAANLANIAAAIGLDANATKAARELYVGNLPPGVDVNQLLEFLNAAMAALKAVTMPGNSCSKAWISTDGHYAFVEFRTMEEASNGMQLNGLNCLGYSLRIGRPKTYPAELAALAPQPTVVALDSSYLSKGIAGVQSGVEAIASQIKGFGQTDGSPVSLAAAQLVANSVAMKGSAGSNANPPDRMCILDLPPELSEEKVRNLVTTFGPVKFFQLLLKEDKTSSGVCICSFQDFESQQQAMEILTENTPYRIMKAEDCVAEGLLADFMRLQIKNGDPLMKPQVATRVIMLCNLVTPEELTDDTEYNEIVEDVRLECANFGDVVSMEIPRPISGMEEQNEERGVGYAFVEFSNTDRSTKARRALSGRKFASRIVEAHYFSEIYYKQKHFKDCSPNFELSHSSLYNPSIAPSTQTEVLVVKS